VKQHGLALQYVPLEYKKAKLCLAAVRQHRWALKYVPEELRKEIRAKLASSPRKR
jgi:hypothetical protein